MATHQGYTSLTATASWLGSGAMEVSPPAALGSLAHTIGTLHKPGETNSIGLVMMGAVEFVASRDVMPSGTNREYGYWRGQYNRTFIDNFDKAWMPLEGSGVSGGYPSVTVTTNTSAQGVEDGGYAANCSDNDCVWQWDGSAWYLYSDMCISGCGCDDPPSGTGTMGDLQSKSCIGGAGSASSSSSEGVGDNVGFARWEKAGALINPIGREAIQQRSLFLSDRSFVNAGSGVDLSDSTGYSIYAKVLPSGNVTGTVIVGQHRENPAQFVLGCDYDGSYYIRSDHDVSGVNTPVYAKTTKSFEDYPYPAHVIGVYASGDAKLKIYVNGDQEGESVPFIRKKQRAANTNVTIGKREFAIAERGFTGWIDEAGVSSKSLDKSDIKAFHDGTFNITDLIFNAKVTPTGDSGLSGTSFGDTGIDALNNNYVEFVVDSGVVGRLNPDGAKGGAFDKELWGQADHAISSVLTFDLTEMPTRFHQLTDMSVDLWVEHSTNHPSGADLSVRVAHKDKTITGKNLHWYPSGVSVPSGSKRLVSITHPLEHEAYYRDGEPSFRNDFDDHQLELIVKYPKSTLPYDAEFKIYSSKLSFSGFDTLAKYNTMTGLTEASIIKGHSITDIDGNVVSQVTGDRSLTMYSFGDSPTLSSGIMNMFVGVGTVDQALNLTLNHDPQTDMGDTASGYLFANGAVAMSGQRMNLYTTAGVFSSTMPLFVKQRSFKRFTSPSLRLEIEGTELSFPRSQKKIPLYLLGSPGFGVPSGDMVLVMPNTHAPLQFANRLLYIGGKQPLGDIPLYLEVAEPKINTTRLFTRGPLAYTPSGIMGMFVKQKDFYGVSYIKALPTIVGTGNMPLFMKGLAAPTGAMNFAMPNVIGSGTKTFNLSTRGFEA
jgi:hypothetical protein